MTDESVSKPMDDTTGSGDDLLDSANRLQASLNEDKVTQGQSVSMSLQDIKETQMKMILSFLFKNLLCYTNTCT